MVDSRVCFYCPCYKSPADIKLRVPQVGDEAGAQDFNLDDEDARLSPSDPRVLSALFNLEALYFCDDCHVIRCPRCVMEEVVSTFCPNCLFEVPSKSNVLDSHCPRNCFKCPLCQSSMQTQGDDSIGYVLQCLYCEYKSSDSGLSFARSGGLGSQIIAQNSNAQQVAFQTAKERFEFDQQHTLERESEVARSLRQYRTAMGRTNQGDTREPYIPPVLASDVDETEVPDLLSLVSLKNRTNMIQRHMQKCSTRTKVVDLLPIPAPLRTKRTKRCRQCRSLLVKPDPKPMSISFRSRLYANRILPRIEFHPVRSSELIPHITSQWVLKLINPLAEACHFTLSTATKTEQGDQVIILCPEFTIGPNSEIWEEASTSQATSSTHGELYESGRNHASVILEVVASPRLARVSASSENKPATMQSAAKVNVSFSVFVQMYYEVEAEDSSLAGQRPADDKKERVRKEIGFWIILNSGAR